MTQTVEAPTIPVVPKPAELDARTLGLQIEAKLADWQIAYEYVSEFPLDDVRLADWAQVREATHIADKDSLAEFRTQMGEGAVYPPIVLMHPDVLVDGNHRLNAAKQLRRRTFPAFVARFTTVDMAKSFAAAMNQINGRRLTAAEAYEIALTMFEMKLDDQAVAREIGRSQETVRQMRRRKEFAERSDRLGISEAAEPVKDSARVKLASIDHDPVFARATKIVAEARPGMADVKKIVKAAEEASSDSEALEALERVRAELAPAGPPPNRVTIPAELKQARMYLGGLVKLASSPLALLDVVDDQHRAESIDRWQQVRNLADEVLRLYGDQR